MVNEGMNRGRRLLRLAGLGVFIFVTGCGVSDGHSGGASLSDSDLVEDGDVILRLDNTREFKVELTHFLDPDEVRVRGVLGSGRLSKADGRDFPIEGN